MKLVWIPVIRLAYTVQKYACTDGILRLEMFQLTLEV